MSHSPAFQLESLSYQTDAVESVVRVFASTGKPAAADLAGNRCSLTWAQISANLQSVAQGHRISDERLNLRAPAQGQPLDVCVEMETGTGKTLVYLRTLYSLHTVYGWNKFIIVVPTVAIRAGVMGTLADFGLVFKERGHRAMELGANLAEQEGEFFVVEVKGTHDLDDPKALTPEEVLKIECAARHFEALGFATTVQGRMVHVQPKRLFAAPRDTYDYFKKADVNVGKLA